MEGSLLARPLAFERGDRLFLTTPVTLVSPTEGQIEEYAFASAVKGLAPNEHIGWLSGRYVEAGRANLNNAMWLSDELALKSLTPMLMPVTVMHDPRTAVGTIADCKLIAASQENASATSRIDTILGIWRHRFPDIWEEAEHNIGEGTLMQSMECLNPSYCCSECGQQFIKLPEGKERASWCGHLRENSSRRILQDVCFTGTGLIFGTRGAQGAYTEAHLDHFQDEVAEYHAKAHIDSGYRTSERSKQTMGRVEIEQSELDALRTERNDARKAVEETAEKNRELTTRLEKAETDLTTEKAAREKAETEKAALEEKAQRATLKSTRLDGLGAGFLAKLGEFTRERLAEAASTQSDEEWDSTLKEKEEMAGVKRDAKADETAGNGGSASTTDGGSGEQASGGSAFSDEELARFAASGVAAQAPPAQSGVAARKLARSFLPKAPAPAASG